MSEATFGTDTDFVIGDLPADAKEEYEIQPGDTCSSLAIAWFKDEERWPEVFVRMHEEFPDDMTTNPNLLPVGKSIAV